MRRSRFLEYSSRACSVDCPIITMATVKTLHAAVHCVKFPGPGISREEYVPSGFRVQFRNLSALKARRPCAVQTPMST